MFPSIIPASLSLARTLLAGVLFGVVNSNADGGNVKLSYSETSSIDEKKVRAETPKCC